LPTARRRFKQRAWPAAPARSGVKRGVRCARSIRIASALGNWNRSLSACRRGCGEPTQAELAAKVGAVAPSVERALAKLFGRARPHLAALYELEAEQLARTLAALLRAELTRAPFRVRAVEQRTSVAIGALRFDVRIDRVDELADGTLAIVDYKTSERATSGEWFGPRLRDAQVPLYASQSAERVSAAVVARLTPAETRYFGFWPEATFDVRQRGRGPDTQAQLAVGARSSGSSPPSSRAATLGSSSTTTTTRAECTRR
jgi:hypothetical protein